MKVTSPLTFEISGEPFLLEKRITLLQAIQEQGSISKAAKAVPMSYKSAWEAVDTMNSLSPEPIVMRETGGKDGGGTTITAYGMMLLENYALLKEEHQRFLARLSLLTESEKGVFKTIERLGLQISARNQIQANVIAVERFEVNANISLQFKGMQQLVSVITKEAVEDLHIKKGECVTVVCKSSHVMVLEQPSKKQCNRMEGSVLEVEQDSCYIKTVIDIGGHDTLVSVLPVTFFKQGFPLKGKRVWVEIEAENIMIGR